MRILWEESLKEGWSRSGWTVYMSLGDCLNSLMDVGGPSLNGRHHSLVWGLRLWKIRGDQLDPKHSFSLRLCCGCHVTSCLKSLPLGLLHEKLYPRTRSPPSCFLSGCFHHSNGNETRTPCVAPASLTAISPPASVP